MGHILWDNARIRMVLYSPNPGAMRIRLRNACDTRSNIIITFQYNNSIDLALPENGIAYTGNTVYGQGSIVGPDNGDINANTWCVYRGAVPYTNGYAEVIVSGLFSRTSYRIQVFSYEDGYVYRSDLLLPLNSIDSNYRSATTMR